MRPSHHIARATFLHPSPLNRLPISICNRIHRTYASQSYGSGEGDPKGAKPQSQGVSQASSDLEHPGPAPPDVGHGTGGGPTKKGGSGEHFDGGGGGQKNGNGGGGDSNKAKSPTKSNDGGGGGAKKQEGGNPPQPKILDEKGPAPPEQQSEDVKAHNEAMARRSDKPYESSGREEKR